jgi:hypothetical protein
MNALEELTEFEDRIDLDHVERRLLDWETRLRDLYSRITSWLPEGWTSAPDGTAPLHEPLMEKFGIAERQLPKLALSKHGTEQATLEPRNLWIIGSNGRVDLTGSVGHFVINDRSEFFERPSWHIAAFLTRLDEAPLTGDRFRQVLR